MKLLLNRTKSLFEISAGSLSLKYVIGLKSPTMDTRIFLITPNISRKREYKNGITNT
jgi:hypothetical protein